MIWVFLVLVAVCIAAIAYLKQSYEIQKARQERHGRWRPRYLQDFERARGAMAAEEEQRFARSHYKAIIGQYRRRGQSADPFWTRAVADLPPEYVQFLEEIDDRVIVRWYAQPERLHNLALQVRSTKKPAREHLEHRLEREWLPDRRLYELERRYAEEDDHDAA